MNTDLSLDFSHVSWNKDVHPGRPSVVLGAYRRASTHGQRSGWRFQETLEDLVQVALRLGPEYGVIVFDEGACSAASIAGRREMPVLLDHLRAGCIQGIVTTDIKRLTRDKTLTDGLEIAELLQTRRGILVTSRRVWDLRNERDFDEYRNELALSAGEVIEIRNAMYAGLEDRAKAVVAGRAPAFFKGRAAVGYKSVVCYREGHSWTTDARRAAELGLSPLTHRGIIIRTWIKCEVCGPWVEALRGELKVRNNLTAVAHELNMRSIPSPWSGARYGRYPWSAKLIRQILMRSIYWGKWRIVYTHTQASDVWSSIDPNLECDISDLAYWSETEARQFQMQFLESYKPATRTMFDHPIVGLVACHICGEPFIGCGDGRMRCVNYLSPHFCPAPVYIQESGAWAALNLYFPLIAGQVVDRMGRLDLHLQRLKSTGVQSRLTALDRRERALGSLPEVFAEHKRLVQGELERIERQRAELRKNSGDVRRALAAFETVARLTDVIRTDPVQTYESLDDFGKASLWKLLLTDDDGHVRPIKVRRVGSNRRYPKYEVIVQSEIAN